MSLSSEDKHALEHILQELSDMLNVLDRMPASPYAVDLLEIAGALLEQQVKEDRVYDIPQEMNEEDTQRIHDLFAENGPLASLDKQAKNADSHITNGISSDIINEGGFHFLNPNEQNKPKEIGETPTPDELKDWFDI